MTTIIHSILFYNLIWYHSIDILFITVMIFYSIPDDILLFSDIISILFYFLLPMTVLTIYGIVILCCYLWHWWLFRYRPFPPLHYRYSWYLTPFDLPTSMTWYYIIILCNRYVMIFDTFWLLMTVTLIERHLLHCVVMLALKYSIQYCDEADYSLTNILTIMCRIIQYLIYQYILSIMTINV